MGAFWEILSEVNLQFSRERWETCLKKFIKQFLRSSQDPLIRAKFTLAHKGLTKVFITILISFMLSLRKTCLPFNVDTICVTFNSLFVNGMNKNFWLGDRTGYEAMATLNLVNFVNEYSSTLDKSPRSKIAKTFHSQLWQMKGSMQNQKMLKFCCYIRKPDTGKMIAISLNTLDALSPLISLFHILLSSNERALRDYRNLF